MFYDSIVCDSVGCWRKVVKTFAAADFVCVDTCTLMRGDFPRFVERLMYSEEGKRVKFTVLKSVNKELLRNVSSLDGHCSLLALSALVFMNQHPEIFIFDEPTWRGLALADYDICRKMMQQCYNCNQILLTQDRNLAASVYNLCNGRTGDDVAVSTWVFSLQNGMPVQHSSHYLNLSPYVELEPWCIRADNEPDYRLADMERLDGRVVDTRSLHTELSNELFMCGWNFFEKYDDCRIYVDSSALRVLLNGGQGGSLLRQFEKLKGENNRIRFHVLTSSLDGALFECVKPWLHVFTIENEQNSLMSEVDSLLASMYASSGVKKNKPVLYITQNQNMYYNIQSRMPRCYQVPNLSCLLVISGDLAQYSAAPLFAVSHVAA